MDPLMQLLIAMVPLVPLLFWAWMFSDMTKNDKLPPCFLTFTNGRNPTFDWSLAFLFLNVFTAIFYYVMVYRKR